MKTRKEMINQATSLAVGGGTSEAGGSEMRSTGWLLWLNGSALSDVRVVLRLPSGTEPDEVLHLHSLVLREASTFFSAHLSDAWMSAGGKASGDAVEDGSVEPVEAAGNMTPPRAATRQTGPPKDAIPIILTCIAENEANEAGTALESDNDSLFAPRLLRLALELIYTNQFALKVTDIQTATALLKAFSFLGVEAGIEWCCRYLSRECIKHSDIATLRKLKDLYPLSSFFSESDGVLSSSMTSRRRVISTSTSTAIEENLDKVKGMALRMPTNSMTIEDLGVLIAKSSTKIGSKFIPFVLTELQENERLDFRASNGFALIHGFETVLMDLETQRNALVDEAYADRDRLQEVEAEHYITEDEDSDEDDRDGVLGGNGNAGIAPLAGVQAPLAPLGVLAGIPVPPGPVANAGGNVGFAPVAGVLVADPPTPPATAAAASSRAAEALKRQADRHLRMANLRKRLDHRRARREKHLAMLKHDYVVRSGRLFKLFGFLGPFEKIVVIDSWISTGHEMFCNTIEADEEKEEEDGDDFEEEDFSDDEDSFAEYDEFDESSSEEEIDSDDVNDSLDEEIEDVDSFVLDREHASTSADFEKGASLRKMSRASRMSESGWETDEDTPNQRRSTVTINEFPTVSSASPTAANVSELLGMAMKTPPLTSILSPLPLRIQTPISALLQDEETYRATTQDFTLQNRGESSSSFARPAAQKQAANEEATTPQQGPTSANSISASNPPLGSAFRSLPSVNNSNHPNFALKTKIKTTSTMSQKSYGAASAGSASGGGARNLLTPPPPPSPNKLRPRRLGRSSSSINGASGGGGAGGSSTSGDFYYSAKARAIAQAKLEKCVETAFQELCALAGCGAIDEWVKVGGGESMRFSLRLRKKLIRRQTVAGGGAENASDGSDAESTEDETDSVHTNGVLRSRASSSSRADNTYTSDITVYAETYGLSGNGHTIINIFLCLFDVLQCVAPKKQPSFYSSRSSHQASRYQRQQAQLRRAFYTSPSYAGYPYEPREGDLTVRDGFDLQSSETLDGCVAGILGSIRNVKVLQFLIKTVLVDHEVGVGRRTGKAVIEGMKAVNSGMKGKIVLG
ncbi:hypothetical protein BC830DRAFT_641566 [Chytriomyces sp. MP71]|nr:hypothetical protein BC830DRAFT_641566 [Chytriomyces sp. MP71]